MLVPVGIALGSNLRNRAAEIDAGLTFLRDLSADGAIRTSPVIETQAIDCPPGTASFLNAVAEIAADPARITPRQMLEKLQEFEVGRGRRRAHARNSDRPLDLDILYFGELIVNEPGLVVPHPRLLTRTFVLGPLAALRPHLILPGQTRTVRDLLQDGAMTDSCLGSDVDPHERLSEIERLAYHLWEREGRPPGRALTNWLKAERLLSDDAFLEHEKEVEEEEGGLIPRAMRE